MIDDHDIDVLARVLLVVFVLALCALMMHCYHASAQEPNLNGADFIADRQFIRWSRYCEHRDRDLGLLALMRIAHAADEVGVQDYGKMVAVAWHEGRFKPDALSPTGYYRGMFQIGKLHQQAMKRLGLNYYCEHDRLQFGMMLFRDSGLKPWSTADLARRDYNRVLRSEK